MKYKELEQRSINHANSLALGYDKEYYDRIYNAHLIKEVNLCIKNDTREFPPSYHFTLCQLNFSI